MMKSYSNNHRQKKIAQFASNSCHHLKMAIDIWYVAEKLYAVDVAMHLCMMTKVIKLITKSVHSAEYHFLLRTRS